MSEAVVDQPSLSDDEEASLIPSRPPSFNKDKDGRVQIDEVIDHIGIGRFHKVLFLLCGMGNFVEAGMFRLCCACCSILALFALLLLFVPIDLILLHFLQLCCIVLFRVVGC